MALAGRPRPLSELLAEMRAGGIMLALCPATGRLTWYGTATAEQIKTLTHHREAFVAELRRERDEFRAERIAWLRFCVYMRAEDRIYG